MPRKRRSAADALTPQEEAFVRRAAETPQDRPRKAGKDQRRASDALLLRVEDDLLQRARNAAAALHTTATEIARHGLRAEVERLEAEHNRGRPFPEPPPSPYATRE
jgi:hypothetical protein